MKHTTILFITWLLVSLGISGVAHADVYVIANPSVELSADNIRDVFIGEKLLVTGVKLAPVDNAGAQAEFLAKVMSLDIAKYSSIWTKKGFRDGLNPPDMKAADSDVILYVRQTPGAIGYISAVPVTTTGFKIIKKY